MEQYIVAGVVSFIYVFCKAFQSMNQVFKKYKWIPPFSYAISYCEVFLWGMAGIAAVEEDIIMALFLGFAFGTGGWIGSISSITLHPKLTGKGYGNKESG